MKVNVEGLELPLKPLTNVELEVAARDLGLKGFRGVFLRDTLPKAKLRNECGIMNFVRSDGPTSGHWVAWIKRGSTKVYFDSYGLKPPNELARYLKEPYYFSTDQVQFDGVYCGHLCLFMLKKTNATNATNLLTTYQSAMNELVY